MPPGALYAKVRVNFSGKRYLGKVTLPFGGNRASDVLNDGHHFLYLEEVQTVGQNLTRTSLALNKSDITYVQAIEEDLPVNPSLIVLGSYLDVDVMMRHPFLHIRGRIFLPDGIDSPSLIINDDRAFLSLRDVTIVGTPEFYPYLAVSKAQTISITVAPPTRTAVTPEPA